MDNCDVESIRRPNSDYHLLNTDHTYEDNPSPFLAYDPQFNFSGTYSVEPMHTVFHGAVKGFFNHALFNTQFHRSLIAG
jgi:hypothetical protein